MGRRLEALPGGWLQWKPLTGVSRERLLGRLMEQAIARGPGKPELRQKTQTRGSAPGLCSTADIPRAEAAATHSCVPLEIQMCSKRKDQEAINHAGTCS